MCIGKLTDEEEEKTEEAPLPDPVVNALIEYMRSIVRGEGEPERKDILRILNSEE